jgi:hypothetical protein
MQARDWNVARGTAEGLRLNNPIEQLAAIAAAIRDLPTINDGDALQTRTAEIASAIEQIQRAFQRPMAEAFLANLQSEHPQQAAARGWRRQKWLRAHGLTEETGSLFRYGTRPSYRKLADQIARFAMSRTTVTTTEVLGPDCLAIPPEQQRRVDHVRVGRCLRAMGWQRRRVGKGTRRHYRWSPPTEGGTPNSVKPHQHSLGAPQTV